jgi:hypothetical protein
MRRIVAGAIILAASLAWPGASWAANEADCNDLYFSYPPHVEADEAYCYYEEDSRSASVSVVNSDMLLYQGSHIIRISSWHLEGGNYFTRKALQNDIKTLGELKNISSWVGAGEHDDFAMARFEAILFDGPVNCIAFGRYSSPFVARRVARDGYKEFFGGYDCAYDGELPTPEDVAAIIDQID